MRKPRSFRSAGVAHAMFIAGWGGTDKALKQRCRDQIFELSLQHKNVDLERISVAL